MKLRINKDQRQLINLQFVITLIIILTLVCLAILTNVAIVMTRDILELDFPIQEFDIETWVSIFVISIVLSTVASTLISRAIFKPLVVLSREFEKVKKGDFSTAIETNSKIYEIRNLYAGYNAMREGLRANETIQSDFVTNVSHEFKTPINAIEGYTTLLQDAQSEEERREYTEKILTNTARLSDLVGNILMLSKLENSSIDLGKEEFSLDEQIRQAIVSLEQKWNEKNIEIDAELEELNFVGNEGLTYRIWYNLIHNAIKFSPEGGLLEIRLEKNASFLNFSVRDYGPGIEEDKIERIYDKFYQTDSSHKSEGNGLGLSLALRIVNIYGGSISVENTRPGCRFKVALPIK